MRRHNSDSRGVTCKMDLRVGRVVKNRAPYSADNRSDLQNGGSVMANCGSHAKHIPRTLLQFAG